ncbi:negative transcriptional regulator, PaiB family [Jatrophihabitans endophyticus]|uniref:Negative transcriptional regulator, PaiB family n=1 Tax=Jatrophihabitans endophyticus TaxID=1206085 RepID=A0A1M5EK09_9ACTN|nr:FMN-binding negative transcriptional regulator [Jatrophihabitans endophyticus]SHF79545.1 negative transcriptional regulator, PaiB family [Jatrophihabitans endophyticus]
MRRNRDYAPDPAQLVDWTADLVRAHPFVTLVSHPASGLVASHYPVLVESAGERLTLLGHVGRPDDTVHELGAHEVLVIVQGPHGYVSSSWYPDRSQAAVPTWNYVTAHLTGVPELLSPEENLRALDRLVDTFEHRVSEPRPMAGTEVDAAYAARISAGTVGFRLAVTHIEAKDKLGQDKPAATVAAVIAELEGDGPYAAAELAARMRAARG